MTSLAQLSALTEPNTTATSFAPERQRAGARVLLIDDERPVWRALRRGVVPAGFEFA